MSRNQSKDSNFSVKIRSQSNLDELYGVENQIRQSKVSKNHLSAKVIFAKSEIDLQVSSEFSLQLL